MREHGSERSLGGGLRQRRLRGQPAAEGYWGQVSIRSSQGFGKALKVYPRLRETAELNICHSVSRVAVPRGPAELRCGAAGRDLDVGVLRGRDAAGGGHVQREVTPRHLQHFGILDPPCHSTGL